MIRQDFDSVLNMFSPETRATYSHEVLSKISPLLGNSLEDTSKQQYQICANSAWYHVVRISPVNDPASLIDLIISTNTDPLQIVALSFKARMVK